jgi:hypothetical protein
MSNYELDRFPQPPDELDEGYCRRCASFITRDELLIDGCTECNDLLIDDMKALWNGRPKTEPLPWIVCPIYAFNFSKGAWITRPRLY